MVRVWGGDQEALVPGLEGGREGVEKVIVVEVGELNRGRFFGLFEDQVTRLVSLVKILKSIPQIHFHPVDSGNGLDFVLRLFVKFSGTLAGGL